MNFSNSDETVDNLIDQYRIFVTTVWLCGTTLAPNGNNHVTLGDDVGPA